jgi:spore coat polysaccharide biosynthesis protein SpsF
VTRAVILLQARMDSRRLPGKSMAPIGARTVVEHCLERLMLGRAAPVVLATTVSAADDCLCDAASRMGVQVFRGSERDVLDRFVRAAEALGAGTVVRATADNPAVDIDAPNRMLALLRSSGADHVSEERLPYGAAVEAVTVAALRRAAAAADDPADREHVTTLMKRDRTRFVSHVSPAPIRLRRPDLRLTVDTPEDLEFMRLISARLGDPVDEPSLAALIESADACVARVRYA